MVNDNESRIAHIIATAEPVRESPIDLKEEGLSQRDALLAVSDRAEVWRSPDGETFATVPVGNHTEHHSVNSRAFRDWMISELARQYVNKGRPASANENAIRDARMGLEARAHFEGMRKNVPLRIAEIDQSIYIDLGTPEWSAVEITDSGWRVVPTAPGPILRSRRTSAFGSPRQSGDLSSLRQLLSHLGDDEFIMFVAWCLGSLLPQGPYPILILGGEQGSGKTTLARLAQRLTDPVNGDLLQPPGDDRDLVAAARNNRVLAFDNFSGIRSELADSLCRLATGSEIGGRALYSNHETATFSACRPIILNGIPDLAARGDLADRAIVIKLGAPVHRLTERDWTAKIAQVLPEALGALFNAVATGLARLAHTPTPDMRMADFARFIIAAEPALPWAEGEFLAAYGRNRQCALAGLVEGDLVAAALRSFAEENRNGWTGLLSNLYRTLSEKLSLDAKRSGDWPGNARWFSDRLRRAAPSLRTLGIDIRERRDAQGSKVNIGWIAALATLATQNRSSQSQCDDASVASAAIRPIIGAHGLNGTPANLPTPGANREDDDWKAQYHERAAIAEFDGGLPRKEAEALAAAEIVRLAGARGH